MIWQKLTKYIKIHSSVELISYRYIEKQSMDTTKIQTMSDVKKKIAVMMKTTSKYVYETENWDYLDSNLPLTQNELPTRSMKDSFDAAIIPIGSDEKLQNKYTGVKGGVRIGRLLEDLDIFSVWVILKHLVNPKQKETDPLAYSIVTGRVDKITFAEDRPSVSSDVKISGHVSWTGKSSAEVILKLEHLQDTQWKLLTTAYFIMMARNRNNNKSAPLNKLVPEGEYENKIYEEAIIRNSKRKKEDSGSLLKVAPDEEEQNIIHKLYISSVDTKDPTLYVRTLPKNSMWMEDTKLMCYIFPHPEDRNSHKTLFGGYIMRITQELAWMVAMFHCKGRPSIRFVSNVLFRRPIYMGELLKLSSQVVYTDENYMQIITFCEVFIVESEESYVSNVMYYTFRADSTVKEVIPMSYRDALLLVDGRRQYKRWQEK